MHPPTETRLLTVDMEPVGRRAQVAPGATVLDAARSAGVGLVTLCGGEGWCKSCRVRLANGALAALTPAEQDALSDQELATGHRLACQAAPLSDVKIEIPPDSLSTPQRLQTEGQETEIDIEPTVRTVDLELSAPTLHDLRADSVRLDDALVAQGLAPLRLNHAALTDLSPRLRATNWSPRLALHDDELLAVLPREAACYGLAVDIGTTKVATYLLRLNTGETVAMLGAMNPQISFGEDVVSRIAYVREHADGRQELQSRLVETLNRMVAELCAAEQIEPQQIVDAVLVGNTAMHHLLAGLPVQQLGLSPYVPAVSGDFEMRARDIGLAIAPAAFVHLPPNIAGFVGADHVAMILATGVWQADEKVVAVDVGTNTEITLACNGRLLACSCASGPAFEGAHIQNGMRAAAGAIERVQIVDGSVHIYTIEHQPPIGICGSGILDLVAEMHSAGAIDDKGALLHEHPLVRPGAPLDEFVLVPAGKTGHGRDIAVTRKDVNEIQLAKAAIRIGLDALLAEADIEPAELDAFIVAGAFGTFINVASAIAIGMFPDLPLERFHQVGNAAGMGAKQMLLSSGQRQLAHEIAGRVEYIELTTRPDFQKRFLSAMYLKAG